VLPILEYCGQLGAPLNASTVKLLEGIERAFTSRISGMRELKRDHRGKLKHLGLYSPERRKARYTILHT
jgi:hypothetical protein